MENIGKILKEKRLELGLTVEQISEKTRLTTKHIKALEEGDITFFKDDLSYLRFFVKSYCEAVGIDFEDLKDELRESVNDYTMTFTNTVTMQHEEMEKHISNTELSKVSKTEENKHRKIKTKKVKRMHKPDFSLVSLIAVAGIVVVVLMFAFVFYLNSSKSEEGNQPTIPPVAQEQEGEGDNSYPSTDDKKEEKPEEKKEVVITKNDVTSYTITEYNEGDEFVFATEFIGANSAYSVSVDGQVLSDPEAKIYYGSNDPEPVNAKVTAKKGTKVRLYFGYINNINIKVNDKSVKMDDSIATSGGSYTLEFTFG